MKTCEEIYALFRQRKNRDAPLITRAMEVRDAYQGDLVVPLPELKANERPANANLIMQAIDQTGMRIGSVASAQYWPALKPGVKKSETLARNRHDTVLGWHDEANMDLKLRYRARYLLAYGRSPIYVSAGLRRNTDTRRQEPRPTWHLRDPLGSYPAAGLNPDEIVPPDCIFSMKRGSEWLTATYPEQMARLKKHESTASFVCVEYVDAEQCSLFVVGDTDNNAGYGYSGGTPYEMLHHYPNRAEIPLVADPSRIGLDRTLGAYDGMVGLYQLQAEMMALNVIGMRRGIFPETWVSYSMNGIGKIIKHADPMKGVTGEIEGGTISTVQMQPGYATQGLIAQLGDAQRAEGSMPSEYSGQSAPNIRTGRRGEQIMSAAVDFFIQEAQVLFEKSLEAENRMAVAVAKAWSGNLSISMYVKGRGKIVYTPNSTFETDVHEVRYPYAGADANGVEIRNMQQLGAKTKSRRTVMEQDPSIRDVELEMDRIESEAVREAFMANLQQMIADPNGPLLPTDIAEIYRLIAMDRADPFEAFDQVQKAAQERQAAQAQGQVDPNSPGAQPGLNAPAPGRPELAPVQGPDQGVQNVAQLMSAIRRPQMALPAERAPAGLR